MASDTNAGIITDGMYDFSGGVSSQRVPTIRSELIPNGLARNQLAWLINGSVRDAGVSPRFGWFDLGQVHPGGLLFQGAELYEPDDDSTPYWLALIGGHVWQVFADNASAAVDLSAQFNLFHPPGNEQAFFQQAEQFMVIQAGDNVTLPLFWDGQTLRRSNGITGNVDPKSQGTINEIPAGTAMDYHGDRLWYAQGVQYAAGDIVRGAAGTQACDFRDAVLKVTENPLAIGGDGFRVDANIRALRHADNINQTLGESPLCVFTRKKIWKLDVPITRAQWINATEPFQQVIHEGNGGVNDRSVVSINGDLYFQSLEPAIRSLALAIRYFGQPSNPPISSNMNRLLKANNRALLHMASGIYFDERLIETALPYRTAVGVAHKALAILDLNPQGTLEEQHPPVWEGGWEGLQILQMSTGDFGGRERAFAFVFAADQTIHLWELTDYSRFETDDKRITMIAETPAFTWQRENQLKEVVGGEIWIDRIYGEVIISVDYRPDGDNCWYPWSEWKECTARDSSEDYFNPMDYPVTTYGDSYRQRSLPKLQPVCAAAVNRPTNIAYQFQLRVTIKGAARLRGLVLHANLVKKILYHDLVPARLNSTLSGALA